MDNFRLLSIYERLGLMSFSCLFKIKMDGRRITIPRYCFGPDRFDSDAPIVIFDFGNCYGICSHAYWKKLQAGLDDDRQNKMRKCMYESTPDKRGRIILSRNYIDRKNLVLVGAGTHCEILSRTDWNRSKLEDDDIVVKLQACGRLDAYHDMMDRLEYLPTVLKSIERYLSVCSLSISLAHDFQKKRYYEEYDHYNESRKRVKDEIDNIKDRLLDLVDDIEL